MASYRKSRMSERQRRKLGSDPPHVTEGWRDPVPFSIAWDRRG